MATHVTARKAEEYGHAMTAVYPAVFGGYILKEAGIFGNE